MRFGIKGCYQMIFPIQSSKIPSRSIPVHDPIVKRAKLVVKDQGMALTRSLYIGHQQTLTIII